MLWFMAGLAFGDGSYQQTRDGRTIVWNNIPKSGDEGSWSGKRDREGYAKGFGTLTWYTAQSGRGGGSAVYARYFGNMIRGKFVGPVNAHSKRKTAHAVFVDGKRTTRWRSGPTPSWRVAQTPVAPTRRALVAEAEAPAEGVPDIAQATPPPPDAVPSRRDVRRQIENTPLSNKIGIDKSLRLLVETPSTLRTRRPSAHAADSVPRLSKEEVIELADAEALTRGYDPMNYQPAEPEYQAANHNWTLTYEQRPFDAIDKPDKHFRVVVDDQTKGRVFLLEK